MKLRDRAPFRVDAFSHWPRRGGLLNVNLPAPLTPPSRLSGGEFDILFAAEPTSTSWFPTMVQLVKEEETVAAPVEHENYCATLLQQQYCVQEV